MGEHDPKRFYAHSLRGLAESQWEPLERHLRWVAEGDGNVLTGASSFAAAFGAAEWGRLAGLWHDLGKFSKHFQDYLRKTTALPEGDPHRLELRGTVDHSTAGAIHAVEHLGPLGRLLAYCIAGHHAGLPDTVDGNGGSARSSLTHRLKHRRSAFDTDVAPFAPRTILNQPAPSPPVLQTASTPPTPRDRAFQMAFFVRLIFSCLVDADFLATEKFFDQDKSDRRRTGDAPSMATLADRLDNHLAVIRAKLAQEGAADSPVNRRRDQVLRACLAAAPQPPGLFSLTVPTGGGKTLSSLAFALRHAAAHDLRRVIVAIPFTSIIEQNAAVYRRALDDAASEVVLEHHSNLEPRTETERSRLAAENWDAPLVVTTNVQLLESLFACRTSRCRKLHRIARSVIVLDEAQALPPNLLSPTLAALRELVTNYGCTIVLCTATQPALEKRPEFPIGLANPRPIIAERDRLFADLKRVEVEPVGVLDDGALVDRLANERQALCIVNTRSHAAELFAALTQRLGETQTVARDGVDAPVVGSCLHLSANMCPRHRTAVLRLIRRGLATGRPCRVISTQLVEAGVDVDFPAVYRAMAGLDAIAQAAGRCNREGKLGLLGRVVLFEPDTAQRSVPTFVRQAIDAASQVLPDHRDLLAEPAQRAYFRLFYWDEGNRTHWDRPPGAGPNDPGVLDCFRDNGEYLQFREAASRYRLIADDQTPILIPYSRRGRALIEQLQRMPDPPGRRFDRQLQRLVVAIRKPMADELLENRTLLEAHGRYVLGNPMTYDRRLGLRVEAGGLNPDHLVV